MDHEIRVFFDWNQFDDDQKYLDQVEVTWEQREPEEICPSGVFESLGVASQPTHGTILRMKELRTTWGDKQVQELYVGLSRLILPIFGQEELRPDDTFEIYLQFPPPFETQSGKVEPSEILTHPHYMLTDT